MVSCFVGLLLLATAIQTHGSGSKYDLAQQCAQDVLQAYPSLPSEWITSDGKFGGNHTSQYVGAVNHSSSTIMDVNMMDGPQGLRDTLIGTTLKNRTSWPGSATYGQAWSPALAYHAGNLGGRDWVAVHASVALTPGVNVHRVPIGGRNWEYVSGEDAFLGRLAAPVMRGIQSRGLMGTLKHYALNNQELNRYTVVSKLDEATLMGTYLRAFEPTIASGVGAVMCSYNQLQVDSTPNSYAYTCASDVLQSKYLRGALGFKGVLMTDWNAHFTNTTTATTVDDGESSSSSSSATVRTHFSWEMLWDGELTTPVPADRLQPLVEQALTGMAVAGIYSNDSIPSCGAKGVVAPSDPPPLEGLPQMYQDAIAASDTAAFSAALVAEGMVMLKNDNDTLPLSNPKRILLAGTALLNGGGSGDSAAFGWYAPHHQGEGLHDGGKMAQDAMVAHLQDAFPGASVTWDYDAPQPLQPSSFDVILAFGAQFRSEAYLVGTKDGFLSLDQCNSRVNYSTYGDCDFAGAFLPQFAEARARGTTVVSIATVGGVHYAGDYLPAVDAALTLFYPGQYFANALAAVLSGGISPGGRLTITLPTLEADGVTIQSPVGRFNPGLKLQPASAANGGAPPRPTLLPPAFLWDEARGAPSNVVQYGNVTSTYAEGALVGYKYYEKYGMAPLFPFGFGLSYASRRAMSASFAACTSIYSCAVRVAVALDAPPAAAACSETVQVYVGFTPAPGSADVDPLRPVKELRGFKKVWASGDYTVALPPAQFHSVWEPASSTWQLPCASQKGSFTLYVGRSSVDLVATASLPCPGPAAAAV